MALINIFPRREDNDGGVLVEFSLLMPLLLLVTFSIVEGGYIYYQANGVQQATRTGARFAATRPVVATVFDVTDNDCMTTSNQNTVGVNCSTFPAANFEKVTCSTGSATGCSLTRLGVIANQMKAVYPFIKDENLFITYEGSGLGYVGRGKPVPSITVELRGIEYNYVAVGHILNYFGLNLATSFKIDNVQTTVIGEDIGEGA